MRNRNTPSIDRREEGVPSPVPEVISDVDDEDEESDRVSYDGEERMSPELLNVKENLGRTVEEDCDPMTRTFMVFFLFLVGMTVTGCRPITLRWAKNGNEYVDLLLFFSIFFPAFCKTRRFSNTENIRS